MPLETAKRAVNFFAEHSVDSDKVSIGCYGGEPLLEFDRIKQITAYAEEQLEGKELQFLITTNATLLTEEKKEVVSMKRSRKMEYPQTVDAYFCACVMAACSKYCGCLGSSCRDGRPSESDNQYQHDVNSADLYSSMTENRF